MGLKSCSLIFVMFSFCNAWAITSLSPIVLNDTLGIEIDSLENNTWHIIGPVPGFIKAKIYRQDQYRCYMHIFQEYEGRQQLIIDKMDPRQLSTFLNDILGRIYPQNSMASQAYLYTVRSQYRHSINKYRFKLVDGNMIDGSISIIRGDTLVIHPTENMRIYIPNNKILQIKVYTTVTHLQKFDSSDPENYRLFLQPTGAGLGKGNLAFSDYYVIFPVLGYGVTDHFTVHAGVTPFNNTDSPLIYAMSRYTFKLGSHAKGGTGVFFGKSRDSDKSFMLGYGTVTLGDRYRNLNIGAGVVRDGIDEYSAAVMLGVGYQLSRHVKLISDNCIITGQKDSFYSISGLRFFGKYMSLDLALVVFNRLFDYNATTYLPWLGFSINLN